MQYHDVFFATAGIMGETFRLIAGYLATDFDSLKEVFIVLNWLGWELSRHLWGGEFRLCG